MPTSRPDRRRVSRRQPAPAGRSSEASGCAGRGPRRLRYSGGDEGGAVRGRPAVRGDRTAVGEQFTGVVEGDHTVAEQTPALFGERRDYAGGIPVDSVG